MSHFIRLKTGVNSVGKPNLLKFLFEFQFFLFIQAQISLFWIFERSRLASTHVCRSALNSTVLLVAYCLSSSPYCILKAKISTAKNSSPTALYLRLLWLGFTPILGPLPLAFKVLGIVKLFFADRMESYQLQSCPIIFAIWWRSARALDTCNNASSRFGFCMWGEAIETVGKLMELLLLVTICRGLHPPADSSFCTCQKIVSITE